MRRLLALSASTFAFAVLATFAVLAVPGDAEAQSCPNSCSGNGICFAGSCLCGEGWSGPDCSVPEVASCPDDCSGHGTCDAGVCQCDTGWEGDSCDQRRRAAEGEITGTWEVVGGICTDVDVATGKRRNRGRWFGGSLGLTNLLVTERDGVVDAFFEALPFVGRIAVWRGRVPMVAAAQCTTTPSSPSAFLNVPFSRPKNNGGGFMRADFTRNDGATYRNCKLWLSRTDDLDPGVPACPLVAAPE